MKKFFQEFKEFATRGNVVDLAVGVIIGAAFQKIVTSAVNDLVMPLIGLITGNSNFNDAFFILRLPAGVKAEQVTSLATATELGVTTFNYGAFISAVIDFLIMAFVIFLMIKALNKASSLTHRKQEEPETPAEPTVKTCPYCLSEIPYKAKKCAHCATDLTAAVDGTE